MTSATKPKSKSKNKKKLLSSSRPKPGHNASANPQSKPSLSSRHTRSLIRTHHTLQKRLHQAQSAGDASLASSLRSEIDASGGLSAYQAASIQGQSADRGGDSSRVLMQWLKGAFPAGPVIGTALNPDSGSSGSAPRPRLRLLEVGALSVDNACSRSGLFEVERIDLHSQHPEIREEDFMERPLLGSDEDRRERGFDVVSLSLVVNFVGSAEGRGRMLERVGAFLRETRRILCDSSGEEEQGAKENGQGIRESGRWFPGLFLVLPAPCVFNSRYLDEERLEVIMRSLGFERLERKVSSKLVYYYYKYGFEARPDGVKQFRKTELRKGGSRNNFAIVL